MNRISALIKETPELPHAFRHAKTVRGELSGALILDFPASRTVKKNLLLKSPHL